MMKEKKIEKPKWQDAIAGACAGVVSRTIMAPIERIKILKQLQTTTSADATLSKYKSSIQISKYVYQEQGLLSFWRGNVPGATRVAGTAAINFASMDYYKRIVSQQSVFIININSNKKRQRRRHQNDEHVDNSDIDIVERRNKQIISFISGGLAGGTSTTILYPFEFIRTRMAMDQGSSINRNSNAVIVMPRQYNGTIDVITKILKSDGILGFFQGYGIALIGSIWYRILMLGGHDVLKSELLHYKHQKQRQDDEINTRRRRRKISVRRKIQTDQQQNHHNHHNDNNNQNNDFTQNNNNNIHLTWYERFILAQCISLFAGTASYPLDSIRRRMMMQAGIPKKNRLYTSSIHCMVTIYKNEGIKGYFLGLGPNIIRSIGGALLLVGYDTFRSMI